MPLFDIETDQGVFTIDADREPTSQEVQDLYSSGQLAATPMAPRAPVTTVPTEVRRQVLAEAQRAERGLGERLAAAPGEAFDLGGQIAGQLVDVVGGGLSSVPRAIQNIAELGAIPGTVRNVQATGRAAGEALLGRLPLDILEFGRQQAMEAFRDPIAFQQRLNPVGLIASQLGIGQRPVDVSENAMEAAAQEALMRQSVQEARTRGVVPEALRQITDQPIADITPTESEGAEFIGLAAPLPVGKITKVAKAGLATIPRFGDYVRKTRGILTDLIKPTTAERVVQEKLQSGAYTTVLPDIQKNYKKGSGGVGFIDSSAKTVEDTFNEIGPAVKRSAPITEAGRDALLVDIDTRLARKVPNIETRGNILFSDEELWSDLGSVTKDNVLDYQRRNNKRIQNLYKNPDATRPDRIYALRATRDAFSDLIKKSIEDEGLDPTNYSKTGLIHELQDQIGDRILQAETQLQGTFGRGVLSSAVESAVEARSLPGGLVAPIREVAAPLTRGEFGRLNRQIDRLFESVTPLSLSPAEAAAIGQSALRLDQQSEIDEALEQSLGQ